MLQFIMEQNILLYAMAAILILGVASQIFLGRVYARLLKDTARGGQAQGKLMRSVRQRAGNGRNSALVIENSLREYQILGRSLHAWQRTGVLAAVLVLAFGGAGWYLAGMRNMGTGLQQRYLWLAAGAAVLTFFTYLFADNGYKKRSLETGLADYLENTLGIGNGYASEGLSGALGRRGAYSDNAGGRAAGMEAAAAESRMAGAESMGARMNGTGAVDDAGAAGTENMGGRASRTGNADSGASEAAAAQEKARPFTSARGERQLRLKETKAQKDKRELKENLSRLRDGMSESAAAREKERNTEILKQMDQEEQERVIREVLKEFLS